ncbi:hypothetical protein QUB37_04455 [Microcoleus sp. AT3-A2]|uniref:hypothetical protein n=1 Tax=unclassified Microcoleus TaxID=2642155 RepID=UPI002FD713B0
MIDQPISAIYLLRETFAKMGAIYAPLLIINSPSLIILLLNNLGLGSAAIPLNIIYLFVLIPFLSGAMIFYSYRSLTGNQVTVSEAFNQANRRLLQLILAYFIPMVLILAGMIGIRLFHLFLPGLILLLIVIFGCYILYRLMFSSYVTVINNSSVQDSLNSSWKLTQGRWWLLFRANFLISIVALVPAILILGLIGSRLGNSLASQMVSNLLGFLVGPLMTVYMVLLYKELRESAATIE